MKTNKIHVFCSCGEELDVRSYEHDEDQFIDVGSCRKCFNQFERIEECQKILERIYDPARMYISFSPKYGISVHPNIIKDQKYHFETLDDFEAWVDQYKPCAKKEILFRKFNNIITEKQKETTLL